MVAEYNKIKNQKLCPNKIKKCNGCFNELLYICSPYCAVKEEHKIELAKYALYNGININNHCCKSNNALVFSIKSKSINLTKFLLEQKICPNSVNYYNESPLGTLFNEIIYNKYILNDNAYNYVELLLKHKADPNMVFDSKTANNFFDILLL